MKFIITVFLLLAGPVGAQTPSAAPSPSASDIEALRKEIEKAAENIQRTVRQRAEQDRINREAVAKKLAEKNAEAARAQAREMTEAVAKQMEAKQVEDLAVQERIQAETRKWIYIIIAFLWSIIVLLFGLGYILRSRRKEPRPSESMLADNHVSDAPTEPNPAGAQKIEPLVDPEMPRLREFWETHRTDGVHVFVTVFNYGRPGNNERVSGYVRFRFHENEKPMIKFPGQEHEVTWENRRKAAVRFLNDREKISAT